MGGQGARLHICRRGRHRRCMAQRPHEGAEDDGHEPHHDGKAEQERVVGVEVKEDAEDPRPAEGGQVVDRLHDAPDRAEVLSPEGVGDKDLAHDKEGVEAEAQVEHGGEHHAHVLELRHQRNEEEAAGHDAAHGEERPLRPWRSAREPKTKPMTMAGTA